MRKSGIIMRLSGLLLCFALVLPAADARAETRAEIFDAGIYELDFVRTVEAPNTASGTQSIVQNEKLLERTTCIPAARGIRFGFRYRVFGEPAGQVALRMVNHYPADGLRNPATNKVHYTGEVVQPAIAGGISLYTGYGFDEDWEVVPGIWVFEIWYKGKLLASQKFEVGCFRGARRQGKNPWHVSGSG
jgi:hypothetical protein